MSKVKDMPAFPSGEKYSVTDYGGNCHDASKAPYYPGMTLRQHYAGLAMQGLCSNPDLSKYAYEKGFHHDDVRTDFAGSAVKMADALIKELERKP